MRKMEEKHISCISGVRVIGILLVIWGHSYPFEVQIPGWLDMIRCIVYSFHMPLFILISGYLAEKSRKTPGDYIAGRAKRLLIPYFALSLAAFFPKVLVQRYLNDSVEFSAAYLLRSELIPRENVWGHFWFIPVIFFFGVFSVAAKKWMKKRGGGVLVLLGAYILLWLPETTAWLAMEDMRMNLFWYVLGMLLAEHDAAEMVAEQKWLLAGIPASLLLALCGIETKTLGAALMIGGIFYLGSRMNVRSNRWLKMIEKYSFSIFLLSWPAQAVVEVIWNRVLRMPVGISMTGMFLTGILVPCVCVKIVKRIEERIPVSWLKLVLGM